jgi:hypothetical protein
VLEKAILRMLEDGKTTTKYRAVDRIKGFAHLLGKPNLLKDKKIASWFYAHPLIKYLAEDNFYSKPAYISAQNFSKVILDLLHGIDGKSQVNIIKIRNSIEGGTIYPLNIDTSRDKNHPAIEAINSSSGSLIEKINDDTALFLKSIWKDAQGDLNQFQLKLEQWFDDTMERATGWYKRYTKAVLFIIGLLIAVIFNVDTVSITKKLSRDPKLREQVVQSANAFLAKQQQMGNQLQQMKGSETTIAYQNADSQYKALREKTNSLIHSADSLLHGDVANADELMALGWDNRFPHLNKDQDWTCYLGWLITALAISLGAPFWFDLLNKLMRLRGSGTKIDSTDSATTSTPAIASASGSVITKPTSAEEAVG